MLLKESKKLKLNVTRIHSYLVTSNKKLKKLRIEETSFLKKLENERKRKAKEKKIEAPNKTTRIDKIKKSVASSTMSFFDKVRNFFGLVAFAILVKAIPEIVSSIKKFLDNNPWIIGTIKFFWNVLSGAVIAIKGVFDFFTGTGLTENKLKNERSGVDREFNVFNSILESIGVTANETENNFNQDEDDDEDESSQVLDPRTNETINTSGKTQMKDGSWVEIEPVSRGWQDFFPEFMFKPGFGLNYPFSGNNKSNINQNTMNFDIGFSNDNSLSLTSSLNGGLFSNFNNFNTNENSLAGGFLSNYNSLKDRENNGNKESSVRQNEEGGDGLKVFDTFSTALLDQNNIINRQDQNLATFRGITEVLTQELASSNASGGEYGDVLGTMLPQGNPQFTSGFRTDNRPNHHGVDFGVDAGSPVHSLTDGVVTINNPKFGNHGGYVFVSDVDSAGNVLDTGNLYGHVVNRLVGVGTRVKKGDKLAEVVYYPADPQYGTGDHSHLHFERFAGPGSNSQVNPIPYFTQKQQSISNPSGGDNSISSLPMDFNVSKLQRSSTLNTEMDKDTEVLLLHSRTVIPYVINT